MLSLYQLCIYKLSFNHREFVPHLSQTESTFLGHSHIVGDWQYVSAVHYNDARSQSFNKTSIGSFGDSKMQEYVCIHSNYTNI